MNGSGGSETVELPDSPVLLHPIHPVVSLRFDKMIGDPQDVRGTIGTKFVPSFRNWGGMYDEKAPKRVKELFLEGNLPYSGIGVQVAQELKLPTTPSAKTVARWLHPERRAPKGGYNKSPKRPPRPKFPAAAGKAWDLCGQKKHEWMHSPTIEFATLKNSAFEEKTVFEKGEKTYRFIKICRFCDFEWSVTGLVATSPR